MTPEARAWLDSMGYETAYDIQASDLKLYVTDDKLRDELWQAWQDAADALHEANKHRLTYAELECPCGMWVVLNKHDGKGISWQLYETGSETDMELNHPDMIERGGTGDEILQRAITWALEWNHRVENFTPHIQCACGRDYVARDGEIWLIGGER